MSLLDQINIEQAHSGCQGEVLEFVEFGSERIPRSLLWRASIILYRKSRTVEVRSDKKVGDVFQIAIKNPRERSWMMKTGSQSLPSLSQTPQNMSWRN